MRLFALTYMAALVAFVILDSIWLGIIAKDFYAETLGYLMRENIYWGAAVVFYALYLSGIVYFACLPTAREGDLKKCIISGTFLGVFAYGTYDLTNYATLAGWPLNVVVYDMLWGAFITGSTAVAGFWVARKLLEKEKAA